MELEEAVKIIGLPKTASEEEFKTKYRKLAKEFHPDVFKEDPDKFKKINEAYQLIQDYKSNPNKFEKRSPGTPFGSPFGGVGFNIKDIFDFDNSKDYEFSPVNINTSISFKDSILGCPKDIEYNKHAKCQSCNGQGVKHTGNNCTSCNGFGQIISNSKGMIFSRTCSKCYGRDIKKNHCTDCNESGTIEFQAKVSIHIPPGTINGSTLRLRGAGHFVGTSMIGDSYTDVYINISVTPEEGLSLSGMDVMSNLQISLLEALTGCSRDVNTIFGMKNLDIPPNIKNKEELCIQGCGVAEKGSQKVIISVEYPNDTDNLIKYLKEPNGVHD